MLFTWQRKRAEIRRLPTMNNEYILQNLEKIADSLSVKIRYDDFEKGDYKTAMKLFSQLEYDDILMNLNAKVMQFKMLYEQDEIDVILENNQLDIALYRYAEKRFNNQVKDKDMEWETKKSRYKHITMWYRRFLPISETSSKIACRLSGIK